MTSVLKVSKITGQDGGTNPPLSFDGDTATFPSGHIIQIQQTVKTTASNQYNSNASINWVDIPDMTCDITPQTGNKVYVVVSANFGSPAAPWLVEVLQV